MDNVIKNIEELNEAKDYVVLRGYSDLDVLVSKEDYEKLKDKKYILQEIHYHVDSEKCKLFEFVTKKALERKKKSKFGNYYVLSTIDKIRMYALRYPYKVVRWLRGYKF